MKRNFVTAMFPRALSALLLLLCFSPVVRAQVNFQVLHSFGGPGDGGGAGDSVAIDTDGNLYGTTDLGGEYNLGTIFELSPNGNTWTETILYNFGSSGSYDGTYPDGALAIGDGGMLYGVTSFGGTHNLGTAFSLDLGPGGWTETILYNFTASENAGPGLANNLVLDQQGNLYGGAATFELSPAPSGWKFSHTCNPLRTPCTGNHYDNTAISSSGTLFAAASDGGKNRVGDVYAVVPGPTSWHAVDLYDFGASPTDGQQPAFGPLVTDSAGNIYGATFTGGSNICQEEGCGTIFKLGRQPGGGWQETILYNFAAPAAGAGFNPIGGVILDKFGNLYGTTGYGGPCGCGVVYELAHNKDGKWTYIVLHKFVNTDGTLPYSSLAFDAHGNLYGTTLGGGQYGGGVVFEITGSEDGK